MPKRTDQDLLAERRAAVLEQMRERDPIARELLQFSIDQIDRQLHERRRAIPVIRAAGVIQPPTRPCRVCGSQPCNPADHVFAGTQGPSEPREYDEMIKATRAAVAKFERAS